MIVDSSQQHRFLGIASRILQEAPHVVLACTDHNRQYNELRIAQTVGACLVDPNCRAFGVHNLFIAGTAVFPSSSYANSTCHAMAMRHRFSKQMLKSLAI